MNQSLGLVALVVRDYDEALNFYVGTLGFSLVEDRPVPEQHKRWVVVAPPGGAGAHLLLARAVGDEQQAHIGNQTAGVSFCFCIPTISGVITRRIGRATWYLCASQTKRSMARWQCFAICMATFGIWCSCTTERQIEMRCCKNEPG